MKKTLLFSALLLAFSSSAYSQAQPLVNTAYSTVMPRLVGESIRKNGYKRGFAANDPRYASTDTALSQTASNVATGTSVLGAVAQVAKVGPPWLSLALTLAGSAVGSFDFGAVEIDASAYAGPDSLLPVQPLYGAVDPVIYPSPTITPPFPETKQYNSGPGYSYYYFPQDPSSYLINSVNIVGNSILKDLPNVGDSAAKYGRAYLDWPIDAKYVTAPKYSDLTGSTKLANSFYADSIENVVLTNIASLVASSYLVTNLSKYSPPPYDPSGNPYNSTHYFTPVLNHALDGIYQGVHPDAHLYPKGTIFYMYRIGLGYLCAANIGPQCNVVNPLGAVQYHPVMPNPRFKGKTELSMDNLFIKFTDPDAQLAVDPALSVATINKLWELASQDPLYTGLPFDPLNPLTEAQLAEVIQANPELAPKVGDYLSPATFPNTMHVPIGDKLPDGQPLPQIYPYSVTLPSSSNPGTSPSGDFQTCGLPGKPPCAVDWGELQAEDPDVAGASSELSQAIKNGPFSDWLGQSFVTSPGTCPQLSLELFGSTVSTDSHCQILESSRDIASLVFAAVWLLVALRIVLSA